MEYVVVASNIVLVPDDLGLSCRSHNVRPRDEYERDLRAWRGGTLAWPGELVDCLPTCEEAEEIAGRLSLASEVLEG